MVQAVKEPRSGSRRLALALVAIAVVAAAIRTPIAVGRGWIGYDEANYLMIARNAEAGLGYTQSALTSYAPKFHPLPFLTVRWLSGPLGDGLRVSKLLFIVLGALTVALVGWLGAVLFGQRAGLVAAALVAVAPVLTSLLVESISHSIFLPIFFAALLLAWWAADAGRVAGGTAEGFAAGALAAAAAGVATGLAWWARADGLILAPALALYLLLAGLLQRRPRRAIVTTTAFVFAFSALYGAYAAFVRSISGGRTSGHGPLYDFLVRPVDCQASRPLTEYGSFLELAINEPGCVAQRIADNVHEAPDVLLTWTGFPAIFLLLIGAAWVAEQNYDRRALNAHGLLAVAILPLAAYLPFYYAETRYVAPYAAVAFVWCARGLVALGDRLTPALGRLGRWGPSLAAVALLAVITALHVPRMEAIGGTEYVAAGRWIDAHAGQRAVVWTSQAQVAYYAHRPWTYPPSPDNSGAWRLPAGDEVFLVVDEREFLTKNREWAPLLTPDQLGFLTLVHTLGGNPSVVSVYRVDRLPEGQGNGATG